MKEDSTIVSNNSSFLSWLVAVAIVLTLGIFAIVYSIEAQTRSDLDATLLSALAENVTYLDVAELINAHNVTLLAQNITWAELRLLLIEGRLAAIQGNVMVMQVSATTIQYVIIPQIYTNLFNIYNNITYTNGNLTKVSALLANVTAASVALNTTLSVFQTSILDTINGQPPQSSNINLNGTCGVTVYAGNLSATVVIDACQFDAQLVNLTTLLYNTAVTLFASVNMSNTTLDTLNWRHPIAGQVFIVANGAGIAITAGNQSNAVLIENTGVVSINGVVGVQTVTAGANIYISPTPSGIEIGYNILNGTFVRSVTGTLGIVNTDGIASNSPTITLNTNLSEYGIQNSNMSQVCMYTSSIQGTTGPSSLFPAEIYPNGLAAPTSFANLLPCGITPVCATCFVTKNCMYNTAILPTTGACFALFQPYAVYKVDLRASLQAYFPYYGNGLNTIKLELQYCLTNSAGACALTSSNWRRVLTQDQLTNDAGYDTWIISAAISIRSLDNVYSQIEFRLYCRAASPIGPPPIANKPCYTHALYDPTPAGRPRVDIAMMITRIV